MPRSSPSERTFGQEAVVRPRSDLVYTIDYVWRGEPARFALIVSDDFARTFAENDAKLDLRTGEVVYRNGRRQDLMASKQAFVALTGREPPPFVFRWPLGESKPFVVPKERLWVDWDVRADRAAFELPKTCVPIFTCLEASYCGASLVYDDAAFAPVTASQRPRLQRRSVGGVEVWAVDEASVVLVDRLLAEVCGALMRRGSAAPNVRVVVVPPGKHFSALPEARGFEETLRAGATRSAFEVTVDRQKPFSAATFVRPNGRTIFAPYDDLVADGHSVRHELYHWIEDDWLGAAAKRAIADQHRRTVERAGPFARPYGYLAPEFFPTLGEVYGGAFGEVGQAWLRSEHAPMWSILRAVEQGDVDAT